MKIYLMRHGIAREPKGSDSEVDSQRPLTARGRDIINKVVRGLKKLEVKPDLILSSPYVRAGQTAAILAKEFDLQQHLVFSDLLVPEGKAEAIISAIVDNFMADELFIVGHLPCLNLLASLLVTGGPGLAINIKKGGVCCLSAGDLHLERCADLEWLMPPKILVKV